MGDAEVDLDAVGVFVAVVLVAAGMPEVVIVLAVFIPAQAGCKPREAKVSLPMTKTACLINSLRDSQTQILRLLLSMAISFLGILLQHNVDLVRDIRLELICSRRGILSPLGLTNFPNPA